TFSLNHITVDHVIPLSDISDYDVKKGAHTWDNVKTCCMGCNTLKGTDFV
ncbi:MAG: 5-methylcytosine-specific restriction endonuclease McrA, partial [Bacteroidia bacterium]